MIRIATLLKRTALPVFRRKGGCALIRGRMDLVSRVKSERGTLFDCLKSTPHRSQFSKTRPTTRVDVALLLDEARRWIRKHQRPNQPLEASMLEFAWPWLGWLVGLPLLAILARPFNQRS